LSLYSVELSPKARKSLRKLSSTDQLRITAAIEILRTNPFPPSVKKLHGRGGYRIRVGEYRVIYEFDGTSLFILVLDIGPRRDIYTR
jgi:mRNA interferase RelE/StbE